MAASQRAGARLIARGILAAVMGFVLLAGVLFLAAGTVWYWQAWAFLIALFLPMLVLFVYLAVADPALLERRLRGREQRSEQGVIVWLTAGLLVAALLVPALDVRFGWSNVPAVLSLTADAIMVAGYVLFAWVLRTNSYASRVIEAQEGQKLVDTGPYGLVRHPMYSAIIVMYLAMPVALGSWWGLIPALATVPMLVARTVDEEKMLVGDLPGYVEYRQRVRWRIVPGIW